MFLGKSVRWIATILLIGMTCQITMAGGNLESIYHTTNGERTTVILRGAATVPYVIHRLDDTTVLIDLPGATANGLRSQYHVDSPSVDSIEVEQVQTVSGESLARMRVHLNTNCDVVPVVRDGLLTFNFAPRPKTAASASVSHATATGGATVITAVGAVSLTDSVVGYIDADGPLQYNHFTMPDGKRVIIDVAGVQDVSTRKAVSVDTNVIKTVRVGQYSSVPPLMTRVVFELGQAVPYTLQQDGNRLLVKFAGQSQSTSSQSSSQSTSSSQQTDDKKPKLNRKDDTTQSGSSTSTGQPTQPSSVTPPGTTPIGGVSQDGSADVKNLRTGKTSASDTKSDSGSGIRVTMDNPTVRPLPPSRSNTVRTVSTSDAVSSDDQNVVTEMKYGNPRFEGDPLSLNLKGVDIREVTNLIAAQFGVNFVYDKSVGGVAVTVNAVDVPWNQMLDELLKSNDLASVVDKHVVRILSTDKQRLEAEGKKKLQDAEIQALPLETRIVRLQYARADGSIGAMTSSSSSTSSTGSSSGYSSSGISGGGGGGGSFGGGGGMSGGAMGGSGLRAIVLSRLSTRGKVELDMRTNSLIITDVRKNLDAALDIIAQLDRPERQVEIELRIVEANSDFQRDLGNQLAALSQNNHSNGAIIGSTLSPTNAGNSTIVGATNTQQTSVGVIPGILSGTTGATGLGAAVPNSILGLTTGLFGTSMISNVLSASEQQGKAKLMSSPRITAQNNQSATIESGVRIPVSTNSNNTITTIYISASLRLEITPMITDNGEVQLHIVAENDQPLFGQRDTLGNIAIATQHAETTVRVPDGGTTIFGGVAVTSDSKTEFRTPGVAKIPIVGELFKRRQTEVKSDELLFFVTPRVTKPQLNGLEDFLPPDSNQKSNPNPTKP